MGDTALIGGPDSQLGNIILGLGAKAFPVETSIRLEAIGPSYDFALGFYNPVTGITQMMGYVMPIDGQATLATDLQDEEHLVQVASPNSSDRFTRYPRVSQGDWTGGQGQLIFDAATRYYQSVGLDITKPGQLQCAPNWAAVGTYSPAPGYQAADYDISGWLSGPLTAFVFNGVIPPKPYWIAGFKSSLTTTNVIINGTKQSVAGNSDVYQFLEIGPAVVMATSTGIYYFTSLEPPVVSTITTETVPPYAGQSMAYFAGFLWYAQTPGLLIRKVSMDTPGAPVTAYTADPVEGLVQVLCSTANGLFFALGNSQSPQRTFLYTFDGAQATRIGDILGVVKCAYEMNGVTYFLAELAQSAIATPRQITLFQITGGSISIVADFRFAAEDFQISATIAGISRGSIDGDGRYIYIAYPGYAGVLVFDPQNNAFSTSAEFIGQQQVPGTILWTHHAKVLTGGQGGGILDLQEAGDPPGGLQQILMWNNGKQPGQLVTSFFDYETPTVVKSWDGLEIDLYEPLPAGASVVAEYRNDIEDTFHGTTIITLSNQQLLATCLPNTRGYRIQWRLTLKPGTDGSSPIIASYGVKGNLARKWSISASCRHNQQIRTSGGYTNDPQGFTGLQLLRNIENAYLLSGYVTLWMPDPTIADPGPYVATVKAYIEDFERRSAPGVAWGFARQDDGTDDMSADVALSLVEAL